MFGFQVPVNTRRESEDRRRDLFTLVCSNRFGTNTTKRTVWQSSESIEKECVSDLMKIANQIMVVELLAVLRTVDVRPWTGIPIR